MPPFRKQEIFEGLLTPYAMLVYTLLVMSVQAGNVLTTIVLVFLASPVLLAGLAVHLEDREWKDLFDRNTASWAFMFGDTIALPISFIAGAVAFMSIPADGWYTSLLWPAFCFAIGLIAGKVFRALDGQNYMAADAEDLLFSPGKQAHDHVAYPVLFGAMLCIGIPVLTHWSRWAFLMLLGLAAWGLFALRDQQESLNPFNLHVRWNPALFEPVK